MNHVSGLQVESRISSLFWDHHKIRLNFS